MPLMVPGEYTAIGWDVAGTVDAVGDSGILFAPGDRVIGLRDRLTAPVGAQAEFVALDADAVAHAPRTASAAEASTLPSTASPPSIGSTCSRSHPASGCS